MEIPFLNLKQNMQAGTQNNPEFIYKKLYIYSYMFKL